MLLNYTFLFRFPLFLFFLLLCSLSLFCSSYRKHRLICFCWNCCTHISCPGIQVPEALWKYFSLGMRNKQIVMFLMQALWFWLITTTPRPQTNYFSLYNQPQTSHQPEITITIYNNHNRHYCHHRCCNLKEEAQMSFVSSPSSFSGVPYAVQTLTHTQKKTFPLKLL